MPESVSPLGCIIGVWSFRKLEPANTSLLFRYWVKATPTREPHMSSTPNRCSPRLAVSAAARPVASLPRGRPDAGARGDGGPQSEKMGGRVKWLLIVAGLLLAPPAKADEQEFHSREADPYMALGWCAAFVDRSYTGALRSYANFLRDACAFGYQEGHKDGYATCADDGWENGFRQSGRPDRGRTK
jgi:hypothetical protein